MTDNINYSNVINKCEILAPAGSYNTMIAAFNAGADAVYVGGSKFGARAFAGNFSEDELLKAVDYAHLFDKKVYLTVNTLLKEKELNELYDYLIPYYEAGLDAVIVQDMGVLQYISKNFPKLPIHCSTQMTITGANFSKVLRNNSSITRIVTPRELNLKEIRNIYDNTGLEIESFVHGALCYCYSGQCLFSSMIGTRSGNRGRCAQPCRLPFSSSELGVNNKHLLSTKDLCTLDILPDILEAGVYSLKIEGRMKKPEYVASVVSMYRKYVDLYLSKGRGKYKVADDDITLLKEIYNRGGFTDGFYMRQNGSEMMTINRPNHSGITVGEVLYQKGNLISVKATSDIGKGDVLEICENTDFFAPYDIKKNTIFEYKIKNTDKTFKADKHIIRTHNDALVKKLLSKFLYDDKGEIITLKRKVNIDIVIKTDTEITAVMWDNEFSVSRKLDKPSYALNKPISQEDIKKQMKKLGGTYLVPDNINISLDDGLFVPIGTLNELRRSLVEGFYEEIFIKYRRNATLGAGESYNIRNNIHNKCDMEYSDTDKLNSICDKDTDCKTALKYSILVSTLDQFNAVTELTNDVRLIVEYANFDKKEINYIINRCNEVKLEIFIALPYIFRDKAVKEFDNDLSFISGVKVSGYLFRNLESYFYLKNNKIELNNIIFDSSIYSFNNEDIEYYKSIGADLVTASYETNSSEFEMLNTQNMEINIYGYFPVMITAGCIRKTLNKCLNDKKAVFKPITLTDRKGSNFKVCTNCRYCYNIIYNNAPIVLFSSIDKISKLEFASCRINFTFETADEVKYILTNHNAINNNYTKGHFNRGVE